MILLLAQTSCVLLPASSAALRETAVAVPLCEPRSRLNSGSSSSCADSDGDLGLPDRRLGVRRERERAAPGGEGPPRADAGEGAPLRPGRLRAQQLEPAPVDVDAPAGAARAVPDAVPAPHHRALRRGRGRRLAGL